MEGMFKLDVTRLAAREARNNDRTRFLIFNAMHRQSLMLVVDPRMLERKAIGTL
jgi:hypothetical protein